MQKRESVLRTFRYEPTDRPPLDIMESTLWKSVFDGFVQKYGLSTKEEILNYLDVDTRWLIAGPGYHPVEYVYDAFGADPAGSFGGAAGRPLMSAHTPEEVASLFHPDPADVIYPDFKLEREKHPDHALIFTPVWMPLFSGASEAFGMEEAMVRMIEEPEVVEEYFRIKADYSIEVFKRGLELGAAEYCDFFWMGDDFCDNRGPLLSLAMWRRMIKPHLARIVAFLKEQGVKVLFHSCGSVRNFIEDFIEIGIDGLCVVQTSAAGMDVHELAEQYGGRIVFWGAVDAQQILTRSTEEEIKAEVRMNREVFAKCGGYVIANSHHSMPDITAEKIEAMCDAAKEI